MSLVKSLEQLQEHYEVASKNKYEADKIKYEFELLSDENFKLNIYYKKDNQVVSTSAGRKYLNNNLLYFCGGNTIPTFRNRGLYQASIAARAKISIESNIDKIISIALKDTSGPILNKLGFEKFGISKFWHSFKI